MSSEPRFVDAPVQAARAYELLAERIRARIRSGELREGDRLPPETALAEEAQVSRSTVREALRMLQEAGYLERSSPRIMVVRAHDPDDDSAALTRAMRRGNLTFGDLHEALLVLEPELTRLAAARADRDDVARLRANLDAQAQQLDDFDAWNRLDQEFHLEIAEMSRNPALVIARTPISELLIPVLHRFMVSHKLTARGLAFHERIFEEIRGGDPEAAALMTRKHINDFLVGWERAGLPVDLQIGEVSDEAIARAGHAAVSAL